ncbi:hypothetical protein PAXINDRAFT_171293 [Paxillus involutus ATCC 200175]|uniref:Uncharacterized protein n=1 Tax=Paxillus involutus ATCC 200175 TaxID=664439 RepID=A0A0C9TP22_PAXIN|nr:hypothetical protein PAXINDRAFT_171293 [Paxillus involutus ATCC 200175]
MASKSSMIRRSAFGLQAPGRSHRIGWGSLDFDGGHGCRTYQGNQRAAHTEPLAGGRLFLALRENVRLLCQTMPCSHTTIQY